SFRIAKFGQQTLNASERKINQQWVQHFELGQYCIARRHGALNHIVLGGASRPALLLCQQIVSGRAQLHPRAPSRGAVRTLALESASRRDLSRASNLVASKRLSSSTTSGSSASEERASDSIIVPSTAWPLT